MKIVIVPDSFKESLSAEKCCRTIKAGSSIIFPDTHYICLLIADGDEGVVGTTVAATGGNIVTSEVCGPMSETVDTFYSPISSGKTTVIKMAVANDLMLIVPEKCNPLLVSGFGTEELIHHVLDSGIRHIVLGVGGSATVDSGMGMAQTLGVRFPDAGGQVLAVNDGNLARVASTEMDKCDPRLADYHIEVACDVDNPLAGVCDTAAVFGPQGGATPKMVEELEQGLQNYARVLQQQTETNACQMAGGDVTGGMGIVTAVFLNADIRPDIETVLNTVNLAQAVQGAVLVITEEGRIDSQTAGGEAPLGVTSVAKQFNVLVVGTAGILGDDVEVVHQYGIDAVLSILPCLAPLTEVLVSGETNLFSSARNITCVTKIGQGIKD